jgi:hypothetical protein
MAAELQYFLSFTIWWMPGEAEGVGEIGLSDDLPLQQEFVDANWQWLIRQQ